MSYIDECRAGQHGGFKRQLVLTWDVADSGNRELLAEQFPWLAGEPELEELAEPKTYVVYRDVPCWQRETWYVTLPAGFSGNVEQACFDKVREGEADLKSNEHLCDMAHLDAEMEFDGEL